MRTAMLITLVLATGWLPLQAQIKPQPDSSTIPGRVVYTVVQQQPEFHSGMLGLMQYLKTNLRYPKAAQAAGLSGRVFVHFLINKQGGIERVQVLKGLSPELDAEAVRLVEAMPNWSPGKVKGQAVDCFFNLPINFTLE